VTVWVTNYIMTYMVVVQDWKDYATAVNMIVQIGQQNCLEVKLTYVGLNLLLNRKQIFTAEENCPGVG